MFRKQSNHLATTPEETPRFLAACEQFLQANRPQVMLTYGGGPLGNALAERAKALGIPVVFWAHDFGCQNTRTFANVDYVVVPSSFAKEFYREHLGVNCHVLPNVIDPVWVRTRLTPGRPPQAGRESLSPL